MAEKPKGVYVPIDVLITDDEDIQAIGMFGFALYVSSLTYSKRRRTDGFIPKNVVSHLLINPSLEDIEECHASVTQLCDVGLWDESETGYTIRNWEQWNPTEDDRERWAERKRKSRQSHVQTTDSVAVTPESRDVTPESRNGHAMSRHEVEEKRREEKRTKNLALAKNERDELFEAVAEVCGIDWHDLTDSARGSLNKAVAQLRGTHAEPDEVRRRARNWPALFDPDTTLTPSALAKHWPALTTARSAPGKSSKLLALAERLENR